MGGSRPSTFRKTGLRPAMTSIWTSDLPAPRAGMTENHCVVDLDSTPSPTWRLMRWDFQPWKNQNMFPFLDPMTGRWKADTQKYGNKHSCPIIQMGVHHASVQWCRCPWTCSLRCSITDPAPLLASSKKVRTLVQIPGPRFPSLLKIQDAKARASVLLTISSGGLLQAAFPTMSL